MSLPVVCQFPVASFKLRNSLSHMQYCLQFVSRRAAGCRAIKPRVAQPYTRLGTQAPCPAGLIDSLPTGSRLGLNNSVREKLETLPSPRVLLYSNSPQLFRARCFPTTTTTTTTTTTNKQAKRREPVGRLAQSATGWLLCSPGLQLDYKRLQLLQPGVGRPFSVKPLVAFLVLHEGRFVTAGARSRCCYIVILYA